MLRAWVTPYQSSQWNTKRRIWIRIPTRANCLLLFTTTSCSAHPVSFLTLRGTPHRWWLRGMWNSILN